MENEFENEMVYWGTLAEKYLHTVKYLAEELVKSENPWIIISDYPSPLTEYDTKTQVSDFNISIPVVYMFYHAIELLLKGGLSADGKLKKKNHNLGELFEDFKISFPHEVDLNKTLSGFLDIEIMPEGNPVKEFCKINKITPSNFYEALRYPENRRSISYQHWPLKYNEDVGVIFFNEIRNGCDSLMKGFVALSRSRPAP